MDLDELEQPLKAEIVGANTTFAGVSTDSREALGDALFVALEGPNFDGHDYVETAKSQGAVAALVRRRVDVDMSQICVADTLVALGQIARLNRQKFNKPLLAITGSAGKTSVKEMLACVLAEEGNVLFTHANLNNEIGVPKTLLRISAEHDFAVVELGASKGGDIAYLVDICKPDVALVTNALPAHIEGFGSLEGVAKTKGEIYRGLNDDGTAIVNLDDAFAPLWMRCADGKRLLTYAVENADATVFARTIVEAQWLSQFELCTPQGAIDIELPVPGRHNIANALAVAASALAMGVGLDSIKVGLESFKAIGGRLRPLQGVNGCQLVDDSYNANPGSVRTAIDVLAGFDCPTTLVLGDMAELGEDSEAMHRDIARYARERNVDRLLAVGDNSALMAAEFGERGQHFDSQQALVEHCKNTVETGEIVLVKGSRSAAMDVVVKQLLDVPVSKGSTGSTGVTH